MLFIFNCIPLTYTQHFGVDGSKPADILSSSSRPVLPRGWNNSQDVYALQYRQEATHQLCLVKAILMEGQLLVNAMASVLLAVYIVVFCVSQNPRY